MIPRPPGLVALPHRTGRGEKVQPDDDFLSPGGAVRAGRGGGAMSPLLEVNSLVKQFGGHRAVDGATFSVEAGSITGLIGPNGAGKTTCFNCIAGFLRSDGGRIVFDGHDITRRSPHRIFHLGLTRTFQIPQELSSLSVLENLLLVPVGQVGERLWEPLLRPWRVRRRAPCP